MKSRTTIGSAPWIAADGTLDLAKFPIDSILKQALSREFERFRSGCVILGSMADSGRTEAGVYLLGLLGYYACDLKRLEIVADALAYFRHAASAQALLGEIRRVKSSNTTRRYLDRVLRSLSHLPADLISAGLQDLAEDLSFSYRMRAKFRQVLECEDW